MTLSVWRYAHLTLALLGSVFILIASVTGMILAFEPIVNHSKSLKSVDFKEATLKETIISLKEKYPEILTLKIDENDFVQAEVIDNDGNNSVFYINPKTAEKVGETFKRADIFTFLQTLHRSLFMGKAGRIIMAVASFLLMLIAISGIFLIIRKQKNWKHFFHNIVKENFFPYYHTIFGRWVLVPIFIITFTGLYLSLEGFSLLPTKEFSGEVDVDALSEIPRKELSDFVTFEVPLSKVRKVEFPLFEDVEEFYRIEMVDISLIINQFTGEVLFQSDSLPTKIISHYSLILHTGRGTLVWALVLFLSCVGILFFIYSGFKITLKRRKSVVKNPFKKEECTHIILVGSEGGSTFYFASILHNELIRLGKKSFLAEMNAFSFYEKMEYLIVMTSTYGQGNEPFNATKFKKLWQENEVQKPFWYSVVGFGSLVYPDFCKYAYEVDELLRKSSKGNPLTDIHTINNQSFESFSHWANMWSEKQAIELQLSANAIVSKKRKQYSFEVIQKTDIQYDETFLIVLKPVEKLKFESGDLLAIMSDIDGRERLYSIGKTIKNEMLLSIKRHEKGIVSNLLNNLKSGDLLKAGLEINKKFHFPKNVNQVVCIATGTGIAPFLGMIENNKKQVATTLIWGGKSRDSFAIYNEVVTKNMLEGKISDLHLALSRSENKCYVQDIVQEKALFFANLLDNNGVVMICGSVAMQRGVITILEKICKEYLGKTLSYFQNRGQIRMDCY
ncbi:PepSY domain-containing protein [Capnocytophaga cynodegmi]|uniref:PepSY domain-containing protein n=1 Tax=Capnocytophaga cynodegmi TaxID=28189 RepID=UPI00385957D4